MTSSEKFRKPAASARPDWRSVLANLEGAYSENTLRGYRADMAAFETWGDRGGFEVLPSTPESVAAFVDAQGQTCAVATVKRRLAAIRKIHALLRLENPVTDETVVIALRRLRRAKRERPRQALGLTKDIRDRLIASCPETLSGLRDRAMIALGYDTLCRRSELVGLRAEDLVRSPDGDAQILVRRSKNDPFGAGRLAYVSSQTLKVLDAWLKAAGIGEGPLVRAIDGRGELGRGALHPYSVTRILKQTATSAGFSPNTVASLSGHSMRVGAAQDMIAAGLGLLPIMQAGGWRTTNVVARYVENANLSLLFKAARTP